MDQNSSDRGPAGGFDAGRLRDVQNWRRSRSDRLIAGVCGGIGRALDIDPVLVRVVFGVLIVLGPGLPLYVAAWLLMPVDGSDRSPAQGLLGDRVRLDHPWLWPAAICLAVFIAIGIASSVNSGPFKIGPLIVLVIIWYVFFRKPDKNGGGPPSTPTAHPTAAPTAAPSAAPSGPASSLPQDQPSTQPPDRPQDGPQDRTQVRPVDGAAAPRGSTSSAGPVQPVWTDDDPLGLYVDEATPVRQAPTAVQVAAPGRRCVKPVVLGATVVAIGIAWMSGASTPLMLAIGLATLGTGMLVGGFVGRTIALLPVGILLAVGVLATQLFPTMPNVREVNYVATPQTTITATSTSYLFDAGSIKLDLTKATFGPGAKVTVNGKAGEVVVTLPKNVDVTGSASVQFGEVRGFDQTRGGHQSDLSFEDLGADGKAGPTSVELDLDLTTGSIKVERR